MGRYVLAQCDQGVYGDVVLSAGEVGVDGDGGCGFALELRLRGGDEGALCVCDVRVGFYGYF